MIKKLMAILMMTAPLMAATPPVTPKADNEGSIGLSTVTWNNGYFYNLNAGTMTFKDGTFISSTNTFPMGSTGGITAGTTVAWTAPHTFLSSTTYKETVGFINYDTLFIREDGSFPNFVGPRIEDYENDNYYPSIFLGKSSGTVPSGTVLGAIWFEGWNTSGLSASAQIRATAAEDWTYIYAPPAHGEQGSYLSFYTTKIDSGSWVERMRIEDDGQVYFWNQIEVASSTLATDFQTTSNASQAGFLRLKEKSGSGTNYTQIQSSQTLGSDLSFTLPDGYGSSGQAMLSNGAGELYFGTVSGGGEFLVSPSTGVLNGNFPNGVKSSTGSIIASGTAGSGTFLRGDASWSAVSASNIGAGTLSTSVIASSIAVNTIYPNNNFVAGTLPSNVIISSAGVNSIDPRNTIKSGALPTSVIASSIAVNTIFPNNNFVAGTLPTNVIASSIAVYAIDPRNNIKSGGMPTNVFISSIAVSTIYPSNNFVAGVLPTNVVASSVAVNTIIDNNVVGVAAGKITAGTLLDTVRVSTSSILASGTASASTYLRGDGSWNTPTGGTGLVATDSTTITGQWDFLNRVRVSSAVIATEYQTAQSATEPGYFRLFEISGSGSNYVHVQSSQTLSSNLLFTLPPTYGSAGNGLITNGAGEMYWGTVTGTGGEFLVSPSTGILSGTLATGVKITTGNVVAGGTASASTFLRGDGSWAAGGSGGDVYLASTQTFTGGNIFTVNPTTFTTSIYVSSMVQAGSLNIPQSSTTGGYIKLYGLTGTTTYAGFIASNTVFTEQLYTLPERPGTSGQVLATAGTSSGISNLYWTTPSGTGDMLKATYDADTDNIVDTAETFVSSSSWVAYDSYRLQGTTYVTPSNIYAGTLRNYVIVSSVAVNTVVNNNIVSLAGTKLTGEVPIANGGTNASSFSGSKFLYYDGSKIADSAYYNTDFAAASHNQSATTITAGTLLDTVRVSTASIIASGTAGSTVFLRGDASWSAVAASNIGAGTLGTTVIASSIAVYAIDPRNNIKAGGMPSTVFVSSINVSTIFPNNNFVAGTLPTNVIASSIAVNAVIDNNISGTITASKIASGTLGTGVIASSIAVYALDPRNNIKAGAMPNTVVTSSIAVSTIFPNNNFIAGTLPTNVICSSIAVNTIRPNNVNSGSYLNDIIVSTSMLTREKIGSYTVSITTPYALGVSTICISNFAPIAVTISTCSAICIGGGSVSLKIQQKANTGIASAGTDIWGASVSAGTTWTGYSSFADATMPADYAMFLLIQSITGEVQNLIIRYKWVE